MKIHKTKSNVPIEWTPEGPISSVTIKENESPIIPRIWVEEIDE